MEVTAEKEEINSFLQKRLQSDDIPEIQAVLVFTSDKASIEIGEEASPPAATVPIGKLKEFFRKVAKNKPISMEKVNQIQGLINP